VVSLSFSVSQNIMLFPEEIFSFFGGNKVLLFFGSIINSMFETEE